MHDMALLEMHQCGYGAQLEAVYVPDIVLVELHQCVYGARLEVVYVYVTDMEHLEMHQIAGVYQGVHWVQVEAVYVPGIVYLETHQSTYWAHL